MRTTVFAYDGGHRIGYATKSLHTAWIFQDARPIIIDTAGTHIFRRWQRYRLHHFCRERQPM